MLSMPELIIVGGLVVLMFGTNKLPKLGGAIGESIKNFKKGLKDEHEPAQLKDEKKDENQNSSKS